jgi:hypothetical protein
MELPIRFMLFEGLRIVSSEPCLLTAGAKKTLLNMFPAVISLFSPFDAPT